MEAWAEGCEEESVSVSKRQGESESRNAYSRIRNGGMDEGRHANVEDICKDDWYCR